MSAGRLLRCTFRGLLSVYSHYGVHARQVAFATLYTGGFSSFVASAAAPIATRRKRSSSRAGLAPLLTSAFHALHSSIKPMSGFDEPTLFFCAAMSSPIIYIQRSHSGVLQQVGYCVDS